MMAPRNYSKHEAQERTIVGLFSIMLNEQPRKAETILVKLQKIARQKSTRSGNVG